MPDASGTKPGTNRAATFLNSPGFGKDELTLPGQEKKSRDHISICARLSLVATTATLRRTHLTTAHFHISPKVLFLIEALLIDTIIPLSKELPIVCGVQGMLRS